MLNLEGIQTRYLNPEPILDQIAAVDATEFVPLMQKLYAEPIQPELITRRIQEIKAQGGIAAVSATLRGPVALGQLSPPPEQICFLSRPLWFLRLIFPLSRSLPWIWRSFASRCQCRWCSATVSLKKLP